MKVLHVHSGNLFGGVETMLLTLARHRQAVPEMEPHFAIAFEGSFTDRLRETGSPVHSLGEVRVRRPMAIVRARRALSPVLREVRPEIVLFHSSWAQAIFAPAVLRERIPFAAWRHDLTTGRHWLERWSARSAPAAIICSSDFIADRTRRIDPAASVFTVHCPVEVPPAIRSRAQIRGELRTPDDHAVLIQLGRFEEWKGHRLLLDALAEVRELENWTCWIVGGAQRAHEKNYAASLQRRAGELNIESRLRFAGHRADVGSLLRAADIFCQPNTRPEPFGIAMIEAMHHGLPVVATAAGGAFEIVDPRSGVLVPPDDPSAFGRALRSLITAPEVRTAAGEGARRRAADLCGVERQIRQLADVLRAAAEGAL